MDRKKEILLTKRVLEVANELINENGYDKTEEAYSQCRTASNKLQEKLCGLVSFKTEVRLTKDLTNTPWDSTIPSIWHWVLVVPMVGIVDVTGKQFNESAVRVLGSCPDHWEEVKTIEGSSVSPDMSSLFSVKDYKEGEDKHVFEAEYALDKLLGVDQVEIRVEERKRNGMKLPFSYS